MFIYSLFRIKNNKIIITYIYKIIHVGPLPPNLGAPPKVLNGNPPVLQNIDTLQVCVKSQIMKQHG